MEAADVVATCKCSTHRMKRRIVSEKMSAAVE